MGPTTIFVDGYENGGDRALDDWRNPPDTGEPRNGHAPIVRQAIGCGTVDSLTPTIRRSDHFLLKPFERRDALALVEAVRSSIPELEQWLPWVHAGYGRADAHAYIRESQRSWKEGKAYDLAIRRPEEPRRHLGNVSVWYLSKSFHTGEIGYWVRSDETGSGIATEVTSRIMAVAFDEMHLHRVILRIAIGNRASERVAEKLGFTREGVLREEIKVRGRWLDHSVWGLLEHEYRKQIAHQT